jgi:predicted transcriptional regulator
VKIRQLLGDEPQSILQLPTDTPVTQAIQALGNAGQEALVVLSEGRFAGVFGPRQLLASLLRGQPNALESMTVGEALDPDPVTAAMDEDVGSVLTRACQARVSRVAVLADGETVTILNTLDVARAHLGTLTDEIAHLQDYISDLHDAPVD